jgi:hypothetical protein
MQSMHRLAPLTWYIAKTPIAEMVASGMLHLVLCSIHTVDRRWILRLYATACGARKLVKAALPGALKGNSLLFPLGALAFLGIRSP